jgi:hypothetical protein
LNSHLKKKNNFQEILKILIKAAKKLLDFWGIFYWLNFAEKRNKKEKNSKKLINFEGFQLPKLGKNSPDYYTWVATCN